MARMRTWVMSDAASDDAVECERLHCWTPRGLTTGAAQPIIDGAKRAGWAATISLQAYTHREAVEKACKFFTEQRAKRRTRAADVLARRGAK